MTNNTTSIWRLALVAATIGVALSSTLPAFAGKGGGGSNGGGGPKAKPTATPTPSQPPLEPTVIGPPFLNPRTNSVCSPDGSCEHSEYADAAGNLDAHVKLPAGTDPNRTGVASASVQASYLLRESVRSVKIEVSGSFGGEDVEQPDLTANAWSTFRSIANHGGCSDCTGEASVSVADCNDPTRTCNLGTDYALTFGLTSPSGSIPPGDIWITAIGTAFATGSGTAWSRVSGYVNQIVVTPIR